CSLVMVYLRRNSGAISSKVSACARLSARATALRVSADASGPSPASTSATGSNRSATTPAKLLAMSTRCDRPSIHADSSSAKPFGAGGRHRRPRSKRCPDMTRPTTHGAPVRRSADMIHSDGRLSFVRCGIHASSAVTSAFATSLRSPSLSLKFFFKLGDQGGRRLVGHEMPRELLGDVPRCRRMAREIGKRGAALIDASVGIALAKHDLLARLMKTLEENKFSAVAGRAYVEEGPAGEHIRKTRDIGLRIAAADAERVQFENLAGEVLVQTLVTIDAGDRIRAHRFRVIEVVQHGRMAFDRGQHVSKGAEDVRAYRLALIGTGHRKDLVGRHTEVVRPKPNKTLDEADVRGDGGFDAAIGLVFNEESRQLRLLVLLILSRPRVGRLRIPVWFHRIVVGRADNYALRLRFLLRALRQLFLRLPFSAELEEGTRRLPAVGQIRRRNASGGRPFEVGQQCAARIVCDRGD